jgi:ornithine cyclodeaminase/alanine dehydrogenase-like protein (mu-crystallin family)
MVEDMEKNTHTPGPDIDVRKVADGYMISQGVRSIGKIYALNEREARVYASAPDLLAALERICKDATECEMHGEPSTVDGIAWEDIIAARAAIAKARAKGVGK